MHLHKAMNFNNLQILCSISVLYFRVSASRVPWTAAVSDQVNHCHRSFFYAAAVFVSTGRAASLTPGCQSNSPPTTMYAGRYTGSEWSSQVCEHSLAQSLVRSRSHALTNLYISTGIAEFAGLEFAGLENDGLKNDGVEQEETYILHTMKWTQTNVYDT